MRLFSRGPARTARPRRLSVEALGDRITPSCGCQLPPSQISGLVYVDQDQDGVADDTEPRLTGVTVTLTGTTADGVSVTMTALTDAGGIYMFTGIEGGTYALSVAAPGGYAAGQSSAGAFGGTTGSNLTTGIAIPQGQSSGGYNFGELLSPSGKDRDHPDNGNHYGWDKTKPDRPKGNNGVGNGLDGQPPGDPPVNDGPGTAPGAPGNQTAAAARARR